MTFNILVPYREYLDLNGDCSNANVIADYLTWLGYQVNLIATNDLTSVRIADIDFLCIGHGAIAAWQALEPEIERLRAFVHEYASAGGVGIAVSSGANLFYAKDETSLVKRELKPKPRVSKFETAADGHFDVPILGYLNSAFDSEVFSFVSNFVLTNLHGPVLSRNPELALKLINLALERKGQQPISMDAFAGNAKIAKAIEYIAGIRALELELAKE